MVTARTLPGVMRPSASALSIMLRPILSFTLEQGSMDSSFAATRATLPFVTLFRYTSGVLPAKSNGLLPGAPDLLLRDAELMTHGSCTVPISGPSLAGTERLSD